MRLQVLCRIVGEITSTVYRLLARLHVLYRIVGEITSTV